MLLMLLAQRGESARGRRRNDYEEKLTQRRKAAKDKTEETKWPQKTQKESGVFRGITGRLADLASYPALKEKPFLIISSFLRFLRLFAAVPLLP